MLFMNYLVDYWLERYARNKRLFRIFQLGHQSNRSNLSQSIISLSFPQHATDAYFVDIFNQTSQDSSNSQEGNGHFTQHPVSTTDELLNYDRSQTTVILSNKNSFDFLFISFDLVWSK